MGVELSEMVSANSNAIVRKSNDLIKKSHFSLSAQQQKIILYLISKIKPNDDSFCTYSFSISEFCEVCGISLSGGNYTSVKNQIKAIADKSMWLEIDNGKGSTLVRWIESPKIFYDSGMIELRLNEGLRPYLLQLKQNFTEYDFAYIVRLRSKYAIRLYELIQCIHYHTGEAYCKEFSLAELVQAFGAESDSYTDDYRAFKRRVLTPSISEINQTTDKRIVCEEVKNGRKVVALRFTVSSAEDIQG